MTSKPKTTVAFGAKRQKLSAPTPTFRKNIKPSKSAAKSPSTPCLSPRRLWQSTAPRAQHPWQVAVRAAADTAQGTEAQRIYSLLSQVLRRNRNQHRAGKWWKWAGLLRREVGRLVRIEEELRRLSSGGAGSGDAAAVRRRLVREAELGKRKEEAEKLVRETLVPRCYLAFSTVVRDGQFAALGVVLMGVLAGLGKEVGLPQVPQMDRISTISLKQMGVDRGEVVRREYGGPEIGVDGGEVPRRGLVGEHKDGDESMVDVEPSTWSASAVMVSSTSRKKEKEKDTMKMKKKGKKSAIDDLFAGLI